VKPPGRLLSIGLRARLARAAPVAAVWLLLAVATTVPYARAALSPPPGRAFAGTFHWIDDFHNYVSFVQQAEDGRFFFQNKLLLTEHEGVLVNLEWWAVGRLSRLCGRRPFLAYRVFALAALAGLLFAADRALRRGGLPETHRLAALLLVGVGGGLGGLLFEFTPRPVFRCADLSIGVFPFFEILANPHWLAGTWLLLESLLAFSGAPTRRRLLLAAALGSALALVRPYDFLLLVAVHVVSVALLRPPRAWLAGWLPLAALAPAALYNYWVFYVSPTFATYTATPYLAPPRADLLFALGPAALLALTSLAVPSDPEGRETRVRLWTWAAVATLLTVVRPLTFSLQFVVGSGLPLLVLAALGLARARPRVTIAAAVLLSSTAVVALRVVLRSEPAWHVPASRRDAALALRETCRPGALLFSPADIGLYAVGLTSCRAFLSHSWVPAFKERQALVQGFYGAAPPAARTALLDRLGISHLVLPGDAGDVPAAWLGEATDFRRVALVGAGAETISVYNRGR
jgi:hypothetical protein